MHFTADGQTFEVYDAPYNTTVQNERGVEIPLAFQFVRDYGLDLEVGNVLAHYGGVPHRVVDRYEQSPGVEQVDVFDLCDPVSSTVAISTLEHVRMDPPEPYDPVGALVALELLRELSEHLFVTVPLGCHQLLDALLLSDRHEASRVIVLERDGAGGWVQTDGRSAKRYGLSTPWAETVWIGEWHAQRSVTRRA